MDSVFDAISETIHGPHFYYVAGIFIFIMGFWALLELISLIGKNNAGTSSREADPAAATTSRSKRRLVILDINNVLLYRVFRYGLDEPDKDPRIKTMLDSAVAVGKFYTWDRPGSRDFVRYCLDNFDVAIWSSAWHQNVDLLCSHVFGDRRKELVFEWDQQKCRPVHDNADKGRPTFLKPISSVFAEFPGRWDEGSVLIIDDSVSKMAANPTGYYIIADAWTPLEERPEIIYGLKPGEFIRRALDKFLEKGNMVVSQQTTD